VGVKPPHQCTAAITYSVQNAVGLLSINRAIRFSTFFAPIVSPIPSTSGISILRSLHHWKPTSLPYKGTHRLPKKHDRWYVALSRVFSLKLRPVDPRALPPVVHFESGTRRRRRQRVQQLDHDQRLISTFFGYYFDLPLLVCSLVYKFLS
jgi:hypothetical protein